MNVAVVGATGAVGETILRLLEERDLPIAQLAPFASRARAKRSTLSRQRRSTCAPPLDDALRDFDVVFFASGEDASERYAPALSNAVRSSSTTARPSACAKACR